MKRLTRNKFFIILGLIVMTATIGLYFAPLTTPKKAKTIKFFEPDWSLTYDEALAAAGEGFLERVDDVRGDRFIYNENTCLNAFEMDGCYNLVFKGDTFVEMNYTFDMPINWFTDNEKISEVENYISTFYKLVQIITPGGGTIYGYRVNWLSEKTSVHLVISRSYKPGFDALSVSFSNEEYFNEVYYNELRKRKQPPQAQKVILQAPTINPSETEQ